MAFVRFVIGGLGAIATTVGIVLVAIAVGLMSWIGDDDTVSLPEIHLVATDDGVVTDGIDVLFEDARFTPDLGRIDLRVRGDGDRLFVGIGEAHRVAAMLAEGGDPSGETFWVASDRGVTTRLGWDIEPGEWSLVALGTGPGDPIVIDGDVTAGQFRAAAVTVAGLGMGAAVAGGLLLVAAFRMGRRSPAPAPSPGVAVRV